MQYNTHGGRALQPDRWWGKRGEVSSPWTQNKKWGGCTQKGADDRFFSPTTKSITIIVSNTVDLNVFTTNASVGSAESSCLSAFGTSAPFRTYGRARVTVWENDLAAALALLYSDDGTVCESTLRTRSGPTTTVVTPAGECRFGKRLRPRGGVTGSDAGRRTDRDERVLTSISFWRAGRTGGRADKHAAVTTTLSITADRARAVYWRLDSAVILFRASLIIIIFFI